MSDGSPQKTDWLQPESPISRLILSKAKRLSRSAGFSLSDTDVIAQELRLAIWQQQPRHQSHRTSFATFADRVINGRAVSLVRSRRARKRGFGKATSGLNFDPPDARGAVVELQTDLQIDLAEALLDVSDELCDLADHLKLHSLHSVGNHLQQSRRSLHRQRQQLRRILEDASLCDYLPTGAQVRARSA